VPASRTILVDPNDPAEAGCAKYYLALIARYQTCLGIAADVGDPLGGNTDPIGINYFCTQFSKLVQGQTVKLDATTLNTCISKVATTSCDLILLRPPTECGQWWKGQLKDGASCTSPMECSHGVCAIAASCPSTCSSLPPQAAPGVACDSSLVLPCTPGYYCDGVCKALPKGGAPCSPHGECDLTFYCDPASNTCKPQQATGSCTDSSVCVNSGLCFVAPGKTAGVCEAFPKIGAPCQAGECAVGAYCTGKGCTEFPTLGGTCGLINNQIVGCFQSWCDAPINFGQYTGTGKCQPMIPVNGKCDVNSYEIRQCQAGARCEYDPSGTARCLPDPCVNVPSN
jgi:hypothetical protein